MQLVDSTIVGVEGTGQHDCFRVSWNLGKFCNYDCSYCPKFLHDNQSPHLALNKIKATIAIITSRETRPIRFSITGGEPFLHPHILDIFAYIKAQKIQTLIVTSNGSLPSEMYIKALVWIDLLTISWHWEYVNTERLQKTLLAIRHAIDTDYPRCKLTLNLMVLTGRIAPSREIYRWCEAHNIRVSLRRIRIATGNPENRVEGEEPYTPDEIAYLETLQSSSNHKNLVLYDTQGQTTLANFNDLTLTGNPSFTGWKCRAGTDSIYIDTDGAWYRGQCRQDGPLKKFPIGPVICSKPWCSCTTDISILKYRPEFENLMPRS